LRLRRTGREGNGSWLETTTVTPIATAKAASRRSFLGRIASLLSAIAGGVVSAPALGALFFPVRQKTVEEEEGYLDVGSFDDLQVDQPSKCVVRATRWDAWSRITGVELGSIWLTRSGDGGVTALSAVCPHLGCSVDFLPENRIYSCPCHGSIFDFSGKTKTGPSPRPMDVLDSKVDGKRVLVKYRRYEMGTPEKREG
jgi:Rieske Fe-S protein